ncbi:hypothetical protein JKF63_05943 [Porcisia hertigi]|uniref:Uncharacterized protein n=1 Tax=Porcisia hertigi TaxID=2761500 RepID=A0A836IWP3_9TRYP|nr:hypothetical protein JKF63_05943 [Porcisia hertigi]
MGAVPSRECTSLFSYFRGTYEVGMIPLTKYYFGKDTDTATTTAGDEPPSSLAAHADTRSHVRQQLRKQLVLMRQDSAALYANARDVENILKSLSHQDRNVACCNSNGNGEARATFAETTSQASTMSPVKTASTSAAPAATTDVKHDAHHSVGATVSEDSTAKTPCTGDLFRGQCNALSPAHKQDGSAADQPHAAEALLMRDYWNIMPDSNFTEEDLDRFLEMVDATLFDTNDELLSAYPISDDTVTASGTWDAKPFLPVPCALCLAYPDGKERDGAFSLDGRVINVIGYFGLMTREMQNAFKVVKRLPSEEEKRRQQQQLQEEHEHAHESGSAPSPLTFLNTAILTCAGDRTLERVLVLASVMLRQQFHTIGRRQLLQVKLKRLLREQSEQKANSDPKMVSYLQALLALPPTTTDQKQPFFDPLLEAPLPSIPVGIYKPTQYINAVLDEAVQQPNASSPSSSLRPAPSDTTGDENPPKGGVELGGSPTGGSSAADVPAGSVPGIALHVPGQGSGSEDTFPLSKDGGGVPLGSDTLAASPHDVHPLPLTQSEEDAITFALCRRMEKVRVVIETASNNYSALKSLTENFAFLCCQIVFDPSLTVMELIDLPALVETGSFKPAASAMTAVSTLDATAADEAQAGATISQPTTSDAENLLKADRLSKPLLSPTSAILIKLDPLHVCQATMWASSFFHCPRLLPHGKWVKYKLKDECEQLRHVLQNKDMLIAHWRKTHVEQAGQYLGKHTARLLEHVRALQVEMEEARALPAEYWSDRPVYVNQDGRKYSLYESRYGTMLIGVRAFPAGNSLSMAAASAKELRTAGAKTAASSCPIPVPACNTTPTAHEEPANSIPGILHSVGNDSGHGLANAPRSVGSQSIGVSGIRSGQTVLGGPNNNDGTSPINMKKGSNISVRQGPRGGRNIGDSDTGYPDSGPHVNHVLSGGSVKSMYATAPFLQPHAYQSRNIESHDAPPYMDMKSNGPGGMVTYRTSPFMPGYPARVASGYNRPPPQQPQCVNMMTEIYNPQVSPSAHNSGYPRVQQSPAYDIAAWPATQSRGAQLPLYPVSSHMATARKPQPQGEAAIGGPPGFAYATASSMPCTLEMPLYHASFYNTRPGPVNIGASASFPQQRQPPPSYGKSTAAHSLPSDFKLHWKNCEASRPSEPAEASSSTTRQGSSTSATTSAAPLCPHGCIGMNQDDIGASGTFFPANPCSMSVTRRGSDPSVTQAGDVNGTTKVTTAVPTSAVLQSVMPWSLKGTASWGCDDTGTDDTTQILLRSTELLDADDGEDKVSASSDVHNATDCRIASDENGLGGSGATQLMAHQDILLVSAANGVTLPRPKPNIDVSAVNVLLGSTSQSQESNPATSSASMTWRLPFSSIAEPSKAAPPASPFQPSSIFPVYVVQLPARATEHHRQQPSTISTSLATTPLPDKPIYYTMPNGVPLLLQPATAGGGMAMAYANGQPLPSDGEGVTPCPVAPQPPQLQQHQQPLMHLIQSGQSLMNMPDIDRLPVAPFSAHTSASWSGQHRPLLNGGVDLASLFTSNHTPVYNNSDYENPFQHGNGFS